MHRQMSPHFSIGLHDGWTLPTADTRNRQNSKRSFIALHHRPSRNQASLSLLISEAHRQMLLTKWERYFRAIRRKFRSVHFFYSAKTVKRIFIFPMPDYALMNQCLYEGKAKEVEEMTKAALAEGRPVQEVLSEGLIAGMSVVGEDFKYNILYVPEVLIAARAMKAGMAVLKPLLAAKDSVVQPAGILLMGTVRGDLHDIGKNLVCMMAEGAGFEVYDIGVDQSIDKFMAAAAKCSPDIIGMSALLTTTMTYMKTVIDGFEAAGLGHIKFAIGGAPISQMYADEIGRAHV